MSVGELPNRQPASLGSTFGAGDLPTFYASADQHSNRWQSRYLLLQRFQLGGLASAGIGGTTSWKLFGGQFSAAIAMVGFTLAAIARLSLSQQQPETKWFDGRAAAESTKTLAWRFAVGGEPFKVNVTEQLAVTTFTNRILELTQDLPSLDSPAGNHTQVTPAMRQLRGRDLHDRQTAYATYRILDQQIWYSNKSNWNEVRSSRWAAALLTIDVLGATAAAARLAGWNQLDLLGIAATCSAIGVAWLQAKQHDLLSRTYAVASHELSAIHDRLQMIHDEAEWASEVEQAEEAISREHTLWRASRSSLR